MPPKRKVASPTTYVLFVVEHVDCYKRASSSGEVIGVFDSEDRAALEKDEMWDQVADNDDVQLRKYKTDQSIPKAEPDRIEIMP